MGKFWAPLSSLLFNDDSDLDIEVRPLVTKKFGIPIYSGSVSNPQILNLVLRAKEDNDLLARRFLAKLICAGIDLIKEEEIVIFPIPSRRKANQVRGINHMELLVREVSRLRKVKPKFLLLHAKAISDQSPLSAQERIENMSGAFKVKRDGSSMSGYIFDDLVTTGSTIWAAKEALKVRNIQVLGAISACASTRFSE